MLSFDVYSMFRAMFGVGIGLIFPILFLLFIWFVVSSANRRKNLATAKSDNLWHYKITLGSGFVIVVLLTALLAIAERLLYDLARLGIGPGYDYFDNLPTISLHAVVILPVLVLSIIVSIVIGEKKKQYAIVFIPYFVASVALAFQLALQVGVFFTNHHTQIQFYIVMVILTVVLSYAIYFIQHRYNQKLKLE